MQASAGLSGEQSDGLVEIQSGTTRESAIVGNVTYVGDHHRSLIRSREELSIDARLVESTHGASIEANCAHGQNEISGLDCGIELGEYFASGDVLEGIFCLGIVRQNLR